MAKFKLNIGDGLLSEVSKSIVKNDFKVNMIPIELLFINPENEGFSMDDIDDLKSSIEEVGLQQNLVVVADGDKFKILTGHRRFSALKMLVDEGKEKFNQVPCFVKDLNAIDLPLNEKTKELYAIATTNAEIRKNTNGDKLKLIEMMSIVYDELKANGYKKLGRRREFIAEKLGISSATANNLYHINNNLDEDIKDKFINDEIAVNIVTKVATLDKPKQKEFLNEIEKEDKIVSVKKADEIIELVKNDKENATYIVGGSTVYTLFERIANVKNKKEDKVISNSDYKKLEKAKANIMDEIEKIEKILSK